MSDDDLRYEDLDEGPYPEDELEPINLDALDDVIESEAESEQNTSTKQILESITTLDDEIEPPPPQSPAREELSSPQPIDLEETAETPVAAEEPAAPSPIDLDVLDDAIEPETKQSEKIEEILESITTLDDEIEPATAEPAEVPAPSPIDPDVLDDAIEPETKQSEKTAPPDWTYRVLVAVPAEMSAEMGKLRVLGEITDMPDPGFELVAPFRAEDQAAVETALRSWARNHLPLQLEVTGVQADVIGARDYIAAWSLLPGDDLGEAQADLRRALEGKVTFEAESPEKLPLRVIVGQKVTPAPFPRMVARMQRDFEPYVWHAETVTLVRQEVGGTTWETVDSYR